MSCGSILTYFVNFFSLQCRSLLSADCCCVQSGVPRGHTDGRFLSGGIILGSPLSCPDLFLYTITLPAVRCDAPLTLSYTTLELASRVLLSSKKPALSPTEDHLHASIAHAALLVISSRICLRFFAFLHTFSLYSSVFLITFACNSRTLCL